MQQRFNNIHSSVFKKLGRLLSIKTLSFKEKISLAYLCKIAGYDDEWKSTIEQAAIENPKSFSHIFSDSSNRVYLPFKRSYELKESDKYIIQYIRDVLDLDIEDNDYIDGYGKDISGRKVRIGKAFSDKKVLLEKKVESLTNFIEKGVVDKNVNDSLSLFKRKRLNQATSDNSSTVLERHFVKSHIENLNAKLSELITNYNSYVSSATRGSKNAKNLFVAISQDPHDIAQASYERAWDSCWNLEGGDYATCAIEEARSGGLIAYVIDEKDLEIKRPYARVLMRKFVSKDGDVIIAPEHTIYGQHFSGLIQLLHKFANEKVNSNSPPGKYVMAGGGHSDTYTGTYIKIPDTPSTEWIFKLLNDSLRRKMRVYTESYFDIISYNYNAIFKDYNFPFSITNILNLSKSQRDELLSCKNKRDIIKAIHGLFPVIQGFMPTPPSYNKRYGRPFSVEEYDSMSELDISYIWDEIIAVKSVDEFKDRLTIGSYIEHIASDKTSLYKEIDDLSSNIAKVWLEIFTENVIFGLFNKRINEVENIIMSTNNSEHLLSCIKLKMSEFAKSSVQNESHGKINNSIVDYLKNIAINKVFIKIPKSVSEPYINALFEEIFNVRAFDDATLNSMLLFYLRKSCN